MTEEQEEQKKRIQKIMRDLNDIGAETETIQHLILKAIDKQINKIIDKTKLREELHNSLNLILSKINALKILTEII